jgi:protein disulfide-isomerase
MDRANRNGYTKLKWAALAAAAIGWAGIYGCMSGSPEPKIEVPLLTDLPQAETQAKAENKRVLLEFTGSDWCPPCKLFRRKVLASPEFTAYAQSNLVVMEVDFPESKPQSPELKHANEALQSKYGVEGYPTFILLSAQGAELRRTVGVVEIPKDFIAWLDQAKPKS